MKRLLSFLLGLTLVATAMAQSATTSENSYLRLEFVSFYESQTVIKVTNKQACQAEIRVYSTTESRTKVIQGFASDTVRLSLEGTKARVWANSATNCAKPGQGTAILELVLDIEYLPIKFKYFNIRKRGGTN